MNIDFITENKLYKRATPEDYGKLNASYNARVRAYEYILQYVDNSTDKRLQTHPLIFESMWNQIIKQMPHIYRNDSGNDLRALDNLKAVLKSYHSIYADLLADIAKLKYRYAADCIRAIDKFSFKINKFVIKGSLQNDVVNEIRKIRKKYDNIKYDFGPEFKKCWNGHMSYADALDIAKKADERDIFVDVFDLHLTIEWFENIKKLIQENSPDVLKEPERKHNKKKERFLERKYTEAQAEIYLLNQELNRMCLKGCR